jgi:hypothetical protein
MGGLLGGLLDISRLGAGVVEVNRGPVAVQPLLERVCRDFEVARVWSLRCTDARCPS